MKKNITGYYHLPGGDLKFDAGFSVSLMPFKRCLGKGVNGTNRPHLLKCVETRSKIYTLL